MAAVPGIESRRRLVALTVVALALVVLATSTVRLRARNTAPPQVPQVTAVASTFYQLRLSIFDFGLWSKQGGALEALGDGFVVVPGDGAFYFLEETTRSDSILVRRLPYQVPMNYDDFARDAPAGAADEFRIGDVLFQRVADGLRLVASHHYWKADSNCFVLRVSVAEVDQNTFLMGSASLNWQTVFDAEPCLPLIFEDRPPGASDAPFKGYMLGGRLVTVDDGRVLLSVGDHAFDGVNTWRILAQDPGSHYGKTVLIDPETGEVEVYTSGHRNPQGLHVDSTGRIWLTEQGPQGGDELNLLERGANYGWPNETYGVQYETATWPLSREPGRHGDSTRPVFAWLPSIATSNLISIERDLFAIWKGDLIVSSLVGGLYRLRYQEDRVIFAEPIALSRRVRDLVEASDGRIVMLLDGGGIGVLEPQNGSDADRS